jgi:nitroreductase/NAD-dependent dihydropyrimidine dehydrogenase PreA subunit
MAEIAINQELCIGCGACVDACSVAHVYGLKNEKAQVLSPSRCWGCGQCVAVCPVDAISHSEHPLDACPVIERRDDDLDTLIGYLRSRRSNRLYKDKQVPREIITNLLNTTRWAPTGSNMQAITWLAVDTPQPVAQLSQKAIDTLMEGAENLRQSIPPEAGPEDEKKILRHAKRLEYLGKRAKRGEKPLFFGAPVVLIAVTPRSFVGRDDAVISGYTLQLTAVQMGLATCQIGYFMAALEFDPNLGRDMLDVQDNEEIQMVLTLGFPKYKMHRTAARAALPIRWTGN